MNYALIENGVVTNLVWLHPLNAKDFLNAVQTGEIPVAIGDAYLDGDFYRDGELLLSYSEQAPMEAADMQLALNELGVRVNG